MPLPNRVTPLGELVADPARGLVYGNRGCLHDREGRIRRRFAGRRWIACRLAFRGWERGPLLQPGRYTELFFLDDATALAAGHRPCALCRRADYERVLDLTGERGADALDARLHAERVDGAARRLHRAAPDTLPDGAFVLRDGAPWLVRGDALLRWTPAGYADRAPRGAGTATVITPPALLSVLRAGWAPLVPFLHPSAAAPIRHVVAGEEERLRELRLRSLAADPDAFCTPYERDAARPRAWWEKWAGESGEGTAQRTFVLCGDDDRWLGLAQVRADGGSATITGMWVAPEARGGGAARRLCDACAGWAAARGCHELTLEVLGGNARARRAYAAAGFEARGAAARDDGRAQIAMARRL